MKRFNTTAVCIPSKHYMVDMTDKVMEIKKLVDEGSYFTINRARQYGKTTTLSLLERTLSDSLYVVSMDFQDFGTDSFRDEDSFCRDFISDFCTNLEGKAAADDEGLRRMTDEAQQLAEDTGKEIRLFTMFRALKKIWDVAERPMVLFIDEVDSAADDQLFIDFLSGLRSQYLKREKDGGYKTFQSVILAGVTDIKHLKSKIRDDAGAKQNSPWNIAADFNVDLSLPEAGIRGMLEDYEADHHTGMDTAFLAKLLRDYTNGYPFLVSRICQLIDTEVSKTLEPHEAWSRQGFDEAIKLILSENNTLFDSLSAKLNNYPDLKASLRAILMEGSTLTFNPDQEDIAQMRMYGFIRNDHNAVRIDNRIFETRLYNLFLSEEEMNRNVFFRAGDMDSSLFVRDGRLNVRLVLERFIDTYHEIYGPLGERFREKDGRELFLLYLKPIINGTGNYYIEAQTRDWKRTDVIIDYLGQQYIIELKIWRGDRYNEEGERQLISYLDRFGLTTGYMLSFNFNKNKETGVKPVHLGDRTIYEGTV